MEYGAACRCCLGLCLGLKDRVKSRLVLWCEEGGAARTIWQNQVRQDAAEDGRQRLEYQHPAPAAESEGVQVLEYPAGNRAADDACGRQSRHEQSDGAGEI